jgi:hypothetical protein
MDQEMIAPELPFEDEQDDPIAAQNLEEFRENEHPIEPPPIPLAHRLLIGPPYETLTCCSKTSITGPRTMV